MSPSQHPIRVLVLSASLRQSSYNHRLALLVAKRVERSGAEVDLAGIAEFEVPLYDQDDEAEEGLPPGAHALHVRLEAADALMIASPEYNASMPGVLKNLIDWMSRFRPQPFNGKQCMLVSASPSMAGGNRGLWSLRVPLEHLGTRVYPDMFSLAQAHEAFDDAGGLTNQLLQKRFEETIGCFLDLVEAAKHYPALKKQWVEFLGEHPNAATDRVETKQTGAA